MKEKKAKIFGTDGVRGRAGEVITPSSVIALGASAGIHFREHSLTNKILVGKDTWQNAPAAARASYA